MVGSSANGGHASGGYFRAFRVKRQAMKKNRGNYVVLVTCGSRAEARKIARLVVMAKLAACANLMSAPVESIYWWKGKVESAREFLLVIKTTRARFAALREAVLSAHSYDVPEIIALSVEAGSKKYLAWIADSVLKARG
jgi:periplasmic divalent cation tolerance protein